MSKQSWSTIVTVLLAIFLVLSVALAACAKPVTTPAPTPKPLPSPTAAPAPTSTPTPKPAPSPTAKPAPIELVFASFSPENHAQSGPPFKEFARRVEERTSGRVKFRVVWGGALLGGNDHLEGLSKGIADMTFLFPSYFPGQLRFEGLMTNVLDLELGPRLDARGIALIHNKLYDEVPELRADYERMQIKVLFQLPVDTYVLGMKNATTFKDLKGKKIRAFGKYLPIMAEAAGATPVTVAGPEIYSALQTGLVDGAFSSVDYLDTAVKAHAIAPYVVSFNTVPIMATGNIAMNMNSWNKLPADIQQIFTQTSKEMLIWSADQIQKLSDNAVNNYAKASGKPASYFSKEDLATWQKAAPLLDRAGKDLDGLGLPGTKTVTLWRQLANDYIAGKLPNK